MSSKNAVGIAPLVTGFLLASQSFEQSVLSDPSLSSVAGLIGGCAAVLVGVGILTGWREFDTETESSGQTAAVALAVIALVAFTAGVAFTTL
ncbi:hypothetical protein SAMN04487950_0122 [Halogranum rubrum]|uniref:Uncharacterized protein n=1 Tax=Halogranum rubrum TaxID=553466 RepID=A0A1I4AWD0_9EURY|nr:hypothetical protein [Halogranum rubrum]SFK60227.1 hypothetical protein SAMN04487950_0122 [Halogranum rubrum]